MSSALSDGPTRLDRGSLIVTEAPQTHAASSTRRMMWSVTFCLLPAALFGIVLFGAYAAALVLASVVATVATEAVITRALGRPLTLGDGSAVLTGLLIGMSLPPTVGFHIPVIAAVFAIAVVKWTFGGLGKNWMNPALAARVFVYFSFEQQMASWRMPSFLADNAALGSADAVSGATVLTVLKNAMSSGDIGVAWEHLRAIGFPISATDLSVTDYLNEKLLQPLDVYLPNGYVDAFLGLTPGSIGEGSALLLLLGTVYLWAKRILRWEISLSFFMGFALTTWAFGGMAYGNGAFSGDVLLHVLSGGMILVMFYMANDPVTSPMSPSGMMIYGGLAGVLTFVLRFFGAHAEGVALAVLLSNVATPVIDRVTRPSRFGMPKGARR